MSWGGLEVVWRYLPRYNGVRRPVAVILCLTVFLTLGGATGFAAEENEKPWHDFFWPLGERIGVVKLKEEYVPFKGDGDIPRRPGLMLEIGDPFLDTGKLDEGFEVPILGAVWQPRLWTYMINRTALQTFDNGNAGRERDTELANRMDLYANLQLTGTEKILLGLRPFDNNEPGRFTRYTFSGSDEDFKNELNYDVESLFFEGDLGSLIPNLDKEGIIPLDFGFTVGRQPFTFQEGILINDTLDAVGFVRNNLPFPGTSNLRISGLWGWDRLNRNDGLRGTDANLYGLFTAVDAPVSTYNLDLIYVDDNNNSDGFYYGLSSIQRLREFGGISSAFRLNGSAALDQEVSGNVIGDGVLLTAEFSKTPHGSNDIAYVNPFIAIGNYTQAGREPIVGGPLANTGILFASPNLSTYGAEIDPFTNEDVGVAVGYQAFWDDNRRNLILEMAGKHDYEDADDNSSLGLGFQLQQAVGQHVQLQLEGFYTFNSEQDDGAGARFEVQVVY